MALPQPETHKLNLGLRTLRFTQELAQMNLPTSPEALVERARAERAQSIEGKYNLVFIFKQLERKGSNYWTLWGCKSIEELLTKFDLPVSDTLANWSVIVELFSKETVLTLGEDSLFLLRRMVCNAQPDPELRKRDYQAIFDAYCKGHDDFDKTRFAEAVNYYINITYVKPMGLRLADNTARPPSREPKGTRTRTLTRAIDAHQNAPVLSRDFLIERRVDSFREIALNHVEKLEGIIRSKLGKRYVPERPKELKR